MGYTRFAFVLALVYEVANAQIIYYLGEAQDAATSMPGIAPGSMFIVKGSFAIPVGLKMSGLPLQESLNGVSLSMTPKTGGDAIHPWIVYTYGPVRDAGPQIAAVLPSTTPPGDYRMMVTWGTTTIGPGWARVVTRKYRSLTNNQEGFGLAVSQNWVSSTRVDRNMFVAGRIGDQTKGPAQPGQTVILWGLGLGKIRGPDNVAPGAVDLRGEVEVKVAAGGVDATVEYAGRSPDFPGLDQINFTLAANTPTGCNIAVQVTVDGVPSNPVTMAVAAPGETACRHPFLTREQLDSLDAGQKFMAAEFHLTRYVEPSGFGQPNVEIHSANGYFDMMTAGRASTMSYLSVAPGRCVAWKDVPWIDATPSDSYDGGRVSVTGEGISDIALTDDDDYYFKLFSVRHEADGTWVYPQKTAQFSPGKYTLKAAGGDAVGPFEAAITLPDFLKWTDRDEVQAVDRTNGFSVSWTGGHAANTVMVQGVAGVRYVDASGDADMEMTTFLCIAAAGTNSFQVPGSILRLLPEVANDGRNSVGFLAVGGWSAGATTNFQAPLKNGGNTGSATLGYLLMTQRFVAFR